MTDDQTALRDLLAKGSDVTFLREMIGFAAERLMELEVAGMTGAAHGERSPERLVQRNGYRDRGKRQPVPAGKAASLKFHGRSSSIRSMVWPRARRSSTAVM